MKGCSGSGGAGKEQPVDIRFEQRCPGMAPTMDNVHDAGRQTSSLETFDHDLGNGRRQLRGFEYAGIARQKRRDDVPIGKVARKVERAEDSHHAMRTMGQVR